MRTCLDAEAALQTIPFWDHSNFMFKNNIVNLFLNFSKSNLICQVFFASHPLPTVWSIRHPFWSQAVNQNRRHLVGCDGSDGAKKALRAAVDIAKHYGAELHAISIEEDPPHYAATVGEVLEAKAEKNGYFARLIEEAREIAAKQGVVLRTKVVPGHEVEAIVDYAKDHHFDLVVIGFMGHSKIYDRVWGSTSQNIARLVPCTVMVVK